MAFKAKRKPSSSSLLDRVPTDILRSIFNKLDITDIVRAKAVCSFLNSLGEELIPSITPWLMLPSKEEVEAGFDLHNRGYNGFLKLGDSQVCSPKKTPKEFGESCCIGSSNGWLIFLGDKAVPFLFHPFKQVKIPLPSVYGLLGLLGMERNEKGEYEVDFVEDFEDDFNVMASYFRKQDLREYFVHKAILTREPNCENKKYGVIMLYNYGMIAYHESESDCCWNEVPDAMHTPYQDFICHKNHLFALGKENNIEVWDFQGGFVSKSEYIVPPPQKSLALKNSLGDLCTSKSYLVESCGDMLLVVRFIGQFVESDGRLVREEPVKPKVCPYRTFLFHVYKLDFDELKWVEIESLGDRSLFLGGNQSISVLTGSFLNNIEENSIYYTDDYWDRMTKDELYGGHDLGIYNLKDGRIKPICKFSVDKILPPPCWIIPNPKPKPC